MPAAPRPDRPGIGPPPWPPPQPGSPPRPRAQLLPVVLFWVAALAIVVSFAWSSGDRPREALFPLALAGLASLLVGLVLLLRYRSFARTWHTLDRPVRTELRRVMTRPALFWQLPPYLRPAGVAALGHQVRTSFVVVLWVAPGLTAALWALAGVEWVTRGPTVPVALVLWVTLILPPFGWLLHLGVRSRTVLDQAIAPRGPGFG